MCKSIILYQGTRVCGSCCTLTSISGSLAVHLVLQPRNFIEWCFHRTWSEKTLAFASDPPRWTRGSLSWDLHLKKWALKSYSSPHCCHSVAILPQLLLMRQVAILGKLYVCVCVRAYYCRWENHCCMASTGRPGHTNSQIPTLTIPSGDSCVSCV